MKSFVAIRYRFEQFRFHCRTFGLNVALRKLKTFLVWKYDNFRYSCAYGLDLALRKARAFLTGRYEQFRNSRIRRRRIRNAPGVSFQNAVLADFGVDDFDQIRNPTRRMHAEFQLSSILRGRNTVRSISELTTFTGKRVLDVGCAYGGFLVAAKEAGGKSVTGIDIGQHQLNLAKALLADYRCDAKLLCADVLDESLSERIGPFDMILCNDVIEHVDDPECMVARLDALLAPGGMVWFEIPNATHVDFMMLDGHYRVFGLTLLPRERAERWWRDRSGFDDQYGVGYYAPLQSYLHIFSQAGWAVRLLNSMPATGDAMFSALDSRFSALNASLATLRDPEDENVRYVQERGFREVARYRCLRRTHDEAMEPAERLLLATEAFIDYHCAFWRLVAVKTSAGFK